MDPIMVTEITKDIAFYSTICTSLSISGMLICLIILVLFKKVIDKTDSLVHTLMAAIKLSKRMEEIMREELDLNDGE